MKTYTSKFVGHCLFFVTALSVSLLIFSVFFDKRTEYDDISSEDNFNEIIKTENSFLMFYSQGQDIPLLEEAWSQLRQTVEKDFSDINMAKFDCSVFTPICEGIGVADTQNYPSLVWMKKGEIIDIYKGEHDVESLKTYVFEMVQSPKSIINKPVDTDVNEKTSIEANSEMSLEYESSEIKEPNEEQEKDESKKLLKDNNEEEKPKNDENNESSVDEDEEPENKNAEKSSDDEDEEEKPKNDENNESSVDEDEEPENKNAEKSSDDEDEEEKPKNDENNESSVDEDKKPENENAEKSSNDNEENDEKVPSENKSESSGDSDKKVAIGGDNEEDVVENDKSKEASPEESSSDETVEKSVKLEDDQKVLRKQFVMKSKPKFLELSAANFSENVNPSGVTFLMMYAPWCEFCTDLRGILKRVALKNGMNSAITIGEMNCMNDENKQFCSDQEIKGVPTLNLYKNGELFLNDYRGTTLEEFEDCIVSHLTEKGIRKWKRREAKRKLLPDSERDEFVKSVEEHTSEEDDAAPSSQID